MRQNITNCDILLFWFKIYAIGNASNINLATCKLDTLSPIVLVTFHCNLSEVSSLRRQTQYNRHPRNLRKITFWKGTAKFFYTCTTTIHSPFKCVESLVKTVCQLLEIGVRSFRRKEHRKIWGIFPIVVAYNSFINRKAPNLKHLC